MRRSVQSLFFGTAFFAIGLLSSIAQGQAQDPAQKVIDAAVAKAKAENKAVFVHFAASW
jgi:hypothetical protein